MVVTSEALFRPISRLIATYYAPSLVMWKENRKSKTIVFISYN